MEYVAALSACALLYKKAFEHGHWDDNGDDLLQMAIRLFEWSDRNGYNLLITIEYSLY